MAGELEPIVRDVLAKFDNLDLTGITDLAASDVQGIDEISRHWMRTAGEISTYFDNLKPMLSDVRSEVSDVREVVWGDAGIVTCWLEQSYAIDGEHTHVSAPTTMVFRREDGAWRIALIHSIPLPSEE